MKTCERCGHEYLDSYEECPFCMREGSIQAVDGSQVVPPGRSGPTLFVWMALAVLVVVGCAAASAMFASSTTGATDQRAILFPEDATPQEQCFIIQQAVEKSAAVREAELGDVTENASELTPEYLPSVPECPEQGEYSFVWQAKLPRYECSVHGWHGNE